MTGGLRRQAVGYAFVLPWLIGLGVFTAYPFFAGLYFSFCDFPPLKGPMLIGADNYAALAGDSAFHLSLAVTMIYAAVAIPLGVLAAMTLALFLNSRIRGQSFYRVVYYLPHLVPTVAVAILWMWIFNPEIGLLNLGLAKLMDGADVWAGLFFHLGADAGGASGPWLRPESLLLLLGPLGWLLSAGRGTLPPLRRRPALRRAATTLAVVATVLAVAAGVHAAGFRLMPEDMKRLHSPGWLTDGTPLPSGVSFAPSGAMWALIVMGLWGVGQMAVIYLAKLQDVPAELYEAAEIDGAGWWGQIRYVTIPMISPVILFNVVMAIIGTFQIFAEPYIMTGGGPENRTRFVAIFVYDQAFKYHRLGYASAVAWVLFLMIVVLTLLTFRISKKHVHYYGR
jgi:ABC-type sugar transport system permease subunit